jgi:hypothetical protein
MKASHGRIGFLTCFGAWCLAISLSAAEPKTGTVDPDVPEPFDASLAGALLENPPFTRALNLSESLLLTGVAYVDGKPVATVKDVRTNQNYLVSDEPNAMGWRLAEASPSMRLDRAEVKIMIGNEIVPVRYSETQMAPQKRSSGRSSSSYNPSRPPTPEEFTGHDEKGAYVRAMPYLNEADREKFRNGISRETREKLLNVVHDNREKMFRYSPDERAGFVKKVFDAVTR